MVPKYRNSFLAAICLIILEQCLLNRAICSDKGLVLETSAFFTVAN